MPGVACWMEVIIEVSHSLALLVKFRTTQFGIVVAAFIFAELFGAHTFFAYRYQVVRHPYRQESLPHLFRDGRTLGSPLDLMRASDM